MDNMLKKMVFGEQETLRQAIDRCLAGARKICFCTNADGKLLGILTQGDILRVLRDGVSPEARAADYMNRDPVTVPDTLSLNETKKLIGRRIQSIPRIDSKGRLIGIVDLGSSEYGFINIKEKTVLILGLGYVGLTLGLILADTGFSVNGFDTNPELVETLRNKMPPFYEDGLRALIEKHVHKGLRILNTPSGSVSDIFILTVGTPVDPRTKKPVMDYIRNAAESIGKILSTGNLVILRSTVMVGATRSVVIPALESGSGLKAGVDFHVAYCPERTAEGRALSELHVLPQIVGGLDEKSIELASRLFNEYTPTIVNVESLEAAELCKLMDNVFRDVKFAYANQLSEIAESLGLNIHKLIDAVNHNYSRNDIPKPSPGVGGPCLTKDTFILKYVFESHGLVTPFLSAARQINEIGPKRIVQKASKLMHDLGTELAGSTVFIVGFAFKGDPETSDLRDSTTLWFLEELRKHTSHIRGYDPVIPGEALLHLDLETTGLEEGFSDADAVFIMNNHRSYLKWNLKRYVSYMKKPALFFDSWHMFSKNQFMDFTGIQYTAIGIG